MMSQVFYPNFVMAIAQMLISRVKSAMGGATIETNLKQFLLVLSVFLSVVLVQGLTIQHYFAGRGKQMMCNGVM